MQAVAASLLQRSANSPKRCWQFWSVLTRVAQWALLAGAMGSRQRASSSDVSAIARSRSKSASSPSSWPVCAYNTNCQH